MSEPRYSIGIDLGTTHCALSYVDFAASDGEKTTQDVLPITQLTAPATIDDLPLLPSFLYLPHPSELAPVRPRFAVDRRARLRRRRNGAQPRRGHADPARVERQELAVPPGRRPPRRDSAERRAA